MSQEWLRKIGTDEVFVRTRILAERTDMQEIGEKEAKALMAKAAIKGTPNAAKAGDSPKPAAPEDVTKMSREDLLALASRLKVVIKDNTPVPAIRAKILAVMQADAASMTDTGHQPPTVGSPDADASKPTVTEESQPGGDNASADSGSDH